MQDKSMDRTYKSETHKGTNKNTYTQTGQTLYPPLPFQGRGIKNLKFLLKAFQFEMSPEH